MSLDSAVAFYERLESDNELAEHIRELGTQEKVEAYVRDELGYDFTREEMQKVIFERHPEMSDEELEAVVGGKDLTFNDVLNGVILVAAAAGAAA
jgi:predicted ribosomally synthesized peptide with nif11-like leader